MNDIEQPVAGPIRPSLTLIGAGWCQPTATHVVPTRDGRQQVHISDTWDTTWFTMTAYLTADEARQIAERFAALAEVIAARADQLSLL